MNRFHNPILLLIISVVLLFSPLTLLSQTNKTIPITRPDSVETENSNHSLFAGLGYGSNLIYLGSSISQDQPYGYASAIYGFRDKLYVGVSSVHLSERNPFVAFNIGSISYNHTINSWFDISGGISYYHIAPSLADTLFGSFFYGDLTLGFDWRILYSKVSTGGLFSEGTSPFVQIRNSRYFQTPPFSKKNFFFSFDPYVNFIFGELTTIGTSTGDTIVLPPYGKGNKKKGQQSSTTEYSTKFCFTEIDLGVPVTFNSDRFTIEIEPGYVLPVYENQEDTGIKGFVILISGYFRIF